MVTRGDREKQEMKLFNVFKKLEDSRYRVSEKVLEFVPNKAKWLGHETGENGYKPAKEKVKIIPDLKHPQNRKKI